MTQDEIQRVFLAFREECIWLRICYNTYKALYESGQEILDAISETAPIFFYDLNIILTDYVILQICKITDPPETIIKKCRRPNLTVQYLNHLLEGGDLLTNEIRRYSENLHTYREKVKAARNRLIAHLDANAVMNGKPIGEHEKEDVEKFFDSLQEYADAVGNAVGVGPLDFRTIPGRGDAIDLIRKLRGQT
jgi:hypothetical protein